MKKELVVLTIAYPDPLLDKELPTLVQEFDKVYVLPQRVEGEVSLLPGVELHSIFKSVDLDRPIPLMLKHFFKIVRVFSWTLWKSPYRKHYIKYIKSFIGYSLLEFDKIKPLEDFITTKKLQSAFFYDYWLVDSTLALAELKRRKIIQHAVARAHGFDLYHERQFEKHVSFQEYRITYLDKVFTISKHGYDYLRSVIHPALADKIKLSYLGILPLASPALPQKREDGYFTLVTCSSIIALKRVDLIARVLKKSTLPIRWIHFGGGPLQEKVAAIARDFPSHVRCEWRGNRPNAEVIDFYRNNYVDLFVSLSKYEGLPVSMMEAIQFGIPIMACSIYGIPEIVTNQTGILLDVDATEDQIVETLEKTLRSSSFDRIAIQKFYDTHFNVENNVKVFIRQLALIDP
jgi:glycosyltransferase involved in cell wall biosynthesis